MNVVIDRKQLLRVLQHGVPPRSDREERVAGPSLVRLETEAERLTVSTGDTLMKIDMSLSVEVLEPGTALVCLARLSRVIKTCVGPALVLRRALGDVGLTVEDRGGTDRVFIPDPPDTAREVPGAVAVPPDWATISGKKFRKLLEQTAFALSRDSTRRPALNGILVLFQPEGLQCVATDGYRLAVAADATYVMGARLSGVTGIVPYKAVVEILRVLGRSHEDVRIAITGPQFPQFVMRALDLVLTVQLVEGPFPDWKSLMPKPHASPVVAEREALAAAIHRVSVRAAATTPYLQFTLARGRLTLLAGDEPGAHWVTESLAVTYAGKEQTIAFNARYILDALAPMKGMTVIMECHTATSPAVFRDTATNYYCVVMPMRGKAEGGGAYHV